MQFFSEKHPTVDTLRSLIGRKFEHRMFVNDQEEAVGENGETAFDIFRIGIDKGEIIVFIHENDSNEFNESEFSFKDEDLEDFLNGKTFTDEWLGQKDTWRLLPIDYKEEPKPTPKKKEIKDWNDVIGMTIKYEYYVDWNRRWECHYKIVDLEESSGDWIILRMVGIDEEDDTPDSRGLFMHVDDFKKFIIGKAFRVKKGEWYETKIEHKYTLMMGQDEQKQEND